ncbi:Eukaryotic translation initiation factor 3 subunit B, partial [Dichanthelium oligosanthes]
MGYANTIVVDNLPVIPPEKFEKRWSVIRKIFSHAGVIKEGGFWMPVNPDTNMTSGYCFIEYNTPQEAALAKEIGNGRKLDKSHVLVVNIFDDFERYMKVPDEWTPAETKPYTPGENLQKWITDEKARDQFVICAGTYTEVYWNDARQLVPELAYQKRWGGGRDDKYFARLGKNIISVYETDTFSLIDKKSLKVESAVDFCWSPTDPIIALFVPEMGGGNQPARVCLVHIPGKEELRQKNLFSVSDCKMYWQNKGEYLAVQVDRYTKSKKTTCTSFELFRIKERDIPIEVLELDNKNAKGFSGKLEFYNVDELETMARGDHFMVSDIIWDSTGRYVATVVTLVYEMENGFYIWSLNGKLLYKVLKDHFFQ